MNRHQRTVLTAAITVLTGVGALAAGCSSAPAPTTVAVAGVPAPAGSWAYPNGDLANTRDAAGSVISSANVGKLREAWTFKLADTADSALGSVGLLAAAPIVVNGTVYLQDLYANVYAISLATGKLRWEYTVGTAEKSGPGPDGVAVAGGVVYGETSTAAFTLNAATGVVRWKDDSLLNSGQGSFEVQPQVSGGRVYLASAYGSGPGGGVLLALDAASGKKLWSFSTVAGGESAGVKAVGLGSGGAWETPLVSADGSTVTFGTGNPYQTIGQGLSHPSRQLYTDSTVTLDAATGALRWYYQAVPDDFLDWDMQLSPIATSVGGVPAVIGGGKMGDVYAMNASSGALLWKTPVGVHTGSDNDPLLALEHKLTLKFPFTYEPGSLGGILTNMAVADGSVYVATIDLALVAKNAQSVTGQVGGSAETGEIEALSLATGRVEWDTHVSSLPLGAATVSNDLVFTTLYNGSLVALNRSTGAVVFQKKLPTSTNAPIAVTGNAILVPAGGPVASKSGKDSGSPQLVAYTVP